MDWMIWVKILAFFDYGRAKMKHPVAGEERIQELSSVGLGMLVELGEHFNEMGVKLKQAISEAREKERLEQVVEALLQVSPASTDGETHARRQFDAREDGGNLALRRIQR